MSALEIATAAQLILQAAVATNVPPVTVVLGFPNVNSNDVLLYLFHNGSKDVEHAGPGLIRRTHSLPIHLMVRADADTVAAEQGLLALHDVVSNAFYASGAVRKLNGAAATSVLQQLDAQGANHIPFIKEVAGGVYRQRWWTLEAAEDVPFNFVGN